MADQNDGFKHAKKTFGEMKELAGKVGSAVEGLFGMGGVSRATSTAAGNAPSRRGSSGGFTPIQISNAEMRRRQEEADKKLADEKARREKRRASKAPSRR